MTERQANWCQCSRWKSGRRGKSSHHLHPEAWAAIREGNPGDVRPVGKSVSELRIDHGPGYRVYFTRRGRSIAILLAGGDKRTQARDILDAQQLARNL